MRKVLPSLQRLRALEAVARLGGFSAAADELLLTQSAVSNQIRLLEDETGVPLLERLGKTAKPTPEGQLLIASSKRIFGELESTLQHLADMQGEVTGRFVMGGGGVASTYFLPPLLARFADQHPRVVVNLHTAHTPELARGLLDGAIDMIVASEPVADPRLVVEPFAEDKLVCVTPPKDPTRLPAVRAKDLAGHRLVLFEKGGPLRGNVDAWLVAAGVDKLPGGLDILDVGLAEAQKSFVMAGFGWSIVSEISVVREVGLGLMRALPLSPPLSRSLTVAWRRDREANPAIKAMRGILAEKAKA
jgi:DNA-binding transcriptional LysR family regulator